MTQLEIDDILADAFRSVIGYCPARDCDNEATRTRRRTTARAMRDSGETLAAIAHRLGVSEKTVRDDLRATAAGPAESRA